VIVIGLILAKHDLLQLPDEFADLPRALLDLMSSIVAIPDTSPRRVHRLSLLMCLSQLADETLFQSDLRVFVKEKLVLRIV
jgi:hypothetical protein